MRYEFIGTSCPNRKACEVKQGLACKHVIEIPASQVPELGSKRKCPIKGCKGRVQRVLSTGVQVCIKGAPPKPKNGTRMLTKVDGKDLELEFVDHPHTDVEFQKKMDQVSAMSGIRTEQNALSRAYRNKDGRMVIDVKSNVPDPLGMIEKDKKQNDYTKVTKKVNTPYRRRKS